MDEYNSWLDLPLAASPWPVQLTAVIVLSTGAVALAWFLVTLQNKSTGMRFRDYWEVIKQDPMAVAVYRVGVLVCIFGTLAYLSRLLV